MLMALSTGHKIGLALSGLVFIGFALVSAMLISRRRPDFPGKALPAFLVATAVLFVGMLTAVVVFGSESKESKAAPEGTTTTTAAPPPAPSAADVAKGKTLYTSLGCSACHSLNGAPGLGPTWKGLAGSQVKLAEGTAVAADDAYLIESIEDPDKQIVAGYQKGVMSATIKPGSVSRADAEALAAYIDSLK